MTYAILEFLLSAGVIVVAGTALTKYGDAIAELTGLGRLLVGSVLVAGATSLPELSVDLNLVAIDEPDTAVGDLLGSCLFNLLILGVLDLNHHSRGRMLSRASASHALSGTASIALTAIAGLSIFLAPDLREYALGRIGLGSIAILLFYVLSIRLVYFDQMYFASQAEHDESEPEASITLTGALVRFAIAAGFIVAAAPFLARAADTISELSGLGDTFVGTTMVALSTSLPELVASLAAIRMNAHDMAIGNVFGSNAFNIMLLVPLDVASSTPLFAEVSRVHVVTAIAVILVTTVAVMGQLYNVEKRIRFVEPDAVLVIALVVAALGLVYFLTNADPTPHV